MSAWSPDADCWLRAAPLATRRRWLLELGSTALKSDVDDTVRDERMRQWRAQPPFMDDEVFARCLTALGVNEEEFAYLLGVPVSHLALGVSALPEWLATWERVLPLVPGNQLQFSSVAATEPSSIGFLPALTPLITYGCLRLTSSMRDRVHGQAPFDAETVQSLLLPCLVPSLLRIASRTLALELNVARTQGLLQGATSSDRFSDFLNHFRDETYFNAFFHEYPVLAQQLTQQVDQWHDASVEFLSRLSSDWDDITRDFAGGRDPGRLVTVRPAGDAHRRSRSVLLLGFSSGMQLVYKPRPLEAEAGFQALLRWLNGCGFSPGFRVLSVSQKEGYGWCEYVEAEDCHSSTQVNRFYARLGGQLALLYVLEATDFHFENLVAEGEHPVLVDLETLFHPRLGAQKDAGADPMAALERSVLRVGLLPHKRWQTAESAGIDLSGLGADSGQLTPFGVPSWDNAGTDEIRLVRRPQLVPSHPNRPLLDGASVDPVDGLDAFVDGFRSVWTMVSQHSTAFLSRDGPLRALVGAPVRVVMRATQTYDILLRESFHPDLLRDALDRDELLNRLWAQVPSSPYLADVLPSEMADLHRGDIPYFTTYPYSRHVWDSSGEKIPGILDRASLEYVRDRVARLGQEELDKQVWFIRASLATMGTRPQFQRRPYCARDDRPELVAREDLLAEACAIGDRLQALSLRSGDQIGWVGLTLRTKDQWSLVPLGLDLYDGLPGVALFFAYLGEITQEPRYVECARVTATTISAGLDRNLSPLRTNGGFNGLGGDLYFLTHLAALWGEPSLRSQAYALLDPIAARVEQDISFDIIGGAAGCIAALLALSRAPGMAHSDRAIELATQCGEHLLRHSHRESSGIGWLNPYISPKPLAGFAHGAAGIAWALSELAAATDDERFRVAAHDAVTYEDSLFSEAEGNWADLRELEPSSERSQVASDQRYTTAWCHGAPGIGLGRLGMLNRMRLPELRVPIESALLTTMEQAFGVNHSLCHGDLGSLEFIAQSSKTFDEGWRVRAGALTGAILERMRSGGWLCGNPLRVESPGLMTGLAGIGYGLLRSAVPDRVPSVLTLEPPVA